MNVERHGRRAERRILAVSGQLYSLLLRSCPSRFRQEHGAEMAQVFRTWCREAYRQGGALAVLRLWPRAFGDLVATALLVRLEGGIRMARIRWTMNRGSGRIAGRVELATGLACALLAMASWLVYLYGPWTRHEACGNPIGACRVVYTSVVNEVNGLDSFIGLFPSGSVLILAHLALALAVAYGAYRHIHRAQPDARLIVAGGTALLLLLTPALTSSVPPAQFPLMGLCIAGYLMLGIGASVVALGGKEGAPQPAP